MRTMILSALLGTIIGALCGIALLYIWEQRLAAQTSSTRFLMSVTQRFPTFTVYELQDNITDSCYIVVRDGSSMTITDPQPCPE